ncbi:hypothetical protein BGZ76_000239 [Entomortierella beljakovae]|nr:hypothetical protein BGZ76_000239 [Entomortierella beljakovae]
MSRIPQDHLDWLKEKIKDVEHVSLENFVAHFDLSDREASMKSFELLISFPELRQKRKQNLQATFEYFCKHYEERFWARREVIINSEIVANRSLVSVQDFGQKQSKIVLEAFHVPTTISTSCASTSFSATAAATATSPPSTNPIEIEERISSQKRPISEITGEAPSESSSSSSTTTSTASTSSSSKPKPSAKKKAEKKHQAHSFKNRGRV